MLTEAGSGMRAQYSVCLLGEDWIQSEWALLNRQCLREGLILKGAQRACTTVIQIG